MGAVEEILRHTEISLVEKGGDGDQRGHVVENVIVGEHDPLMGRSQHSGVDPGDLAVPVRRYSADTHTPETREAGAVGTAEDGCRGTVRDDHLDTAIVEPREHLAEIGVPSANTIATDRQDVADLFRFARQRWTRRYR